MKVTGETMSTLRLPSINGSDVLEFRFRPEPTSGFGVVERRRLTAAGAEFLDGESAWERVSDEEIARQLEVIGPVAGWLTRE